MTQSPTLQICHALAQKFPRPQDEEFMAICTHWQAKNGEDSLFGFKVARWVIQNIRENMPLYTFELGNRLEAVYTRIIDSRRPPTADDLHEMAMIGDQVKKDYNRGFWVLIEAILTNLIAQKVDKGLQLNLEANPHADQAAGEALLDFLRPAHPSA